MYVMHVRAYGLHRCGVEGRSAGIVAACANTRRSTFSEFTRRLPATPGETWKWEGAIKGTYTDVPRIGGGILTPVSPSASLKLAQGGALGAGVGAEASIRLIKDTLELSVGGEVATQFDPHDGNVHVGGEVSGALKRNLDILRRLGKR